MLAPLERRAERRLREVPLLVRAELVVGPRGELEARVHAEELVEERGKVEAAEDLRLDLLARAEDVRVVLRHVPDAQQPVQGARRLVAVQRRRLGVAKRQVAVAPELAAEEEHVPRAVHRLQAGARLLPLARDEEHLAAELLPVPGGLPDDLVVDERRLHLQVAAPRVLRAAQVLEHVPERHALRVPERRAGRGVLEVEQVELRADAAVVVRPRLLEPLEVRVEVGLREERRSVDPGQLRVLLVAAPVRAGEPGELEAP